MRDKFVKTLLEIAKKDSKVHIITGDLGFGVLKPFWDELPNQITNVGIAEQNMTGFATGLALEGKIVYTYSIGNFPTLRTLEQIRNDAAYHNANVKIVCVGGGFVYGSLGMSHHATEDIAIMRSLPNLKVVAPSDLIEAEEATKISYINNGPFYLRLGRGGEKRIHKKNVNLVLGKAVKVQDGKKIAIISTGAIFDEVFEVIEMLKKKNITPTIYTHPFIKPIDHMNIIELSKKHEYIFSVEEHNLDAGFGSAVAEVFADNFICNSKLIRIGINNQYSSIVGDQKFLRDTYNLSSKKIYKKIIDTLEEEK